MMCTAGGCVLLVTVGAVGFGATAALGAVDGGGVLGPRVVARGAVIVGGTVGTSARAPTGGAPVVGTLRAIVGGGRVGGGAAGGATVAGETDGRTSAPNAHASMLPGCG